VSIERVIEGLSWLIMILLLYIYVPKEKIREAQIAFLAQQAITWAFGFAVVEMRLLEYPVRFFEYASRTSFTFEYFVYPSISVLFVLYHPNGKGILKQLGYNAKYCSVITGIEVILERYTDLISYHHWNWLYTWIGVFITLYLCNRYHQWFFKQDKSNN